MSDSLHQYNLMLTFKPHMLSQTDFVLHIPATLAAHEMQ